MGKYRRLNLVSFTGRGNARYVRPLAGQLTGCATIAEICALGTGVTYDDPGSACVRPSGETNHMTTEAWVRSLSLQRKTSSLLLVIVTEAIEHAFQYAFPRHPVQVRRARERVPGADQVWCRRSSVITKTMWGHPPRRAACAQWHRRCGAQQRAARHLHRTTPRSRYISARRPTMSMEWNESPLQRTGTAARSRSAAMMWCELSLRASTLAN